MSSSSPEGRIHLVVMNSPHGAVVCSVAAGDHRAACFHNENNAKARRDELASKAPKAQFAVLPIELLP